MARTTSKVQDLSVGLYSFDGSNKTSHLVAFDTTSTDKVVLACANVNYTIDSTTNDVLGLDTVPAIGVIQRHYTNKVQIRRQGQVSIKKETGTHIFPGEIVFLSYSEPGRVTNVPPTQGVLQQIGIAENEAVGNTNVKVTFAYSHIVLLS